MPRKREAFIEDSGTFLVVATVRLSVSPSVCWSTWLFVYLLFCWSAYILIFVLLVCMSVDLYFCLSVYWFICLMVCVSLGISVSWSVYLLVFPSPGLSVSWSICLLNCDMWCSLGFFTNNIVQNIWNAGIISPRNQRLVQWKCETQDKQHIFLSTTFAAQDVQ